ncbi:MAG: hypothetical protein LBD23_18360 [Oscillospiraceae bacterium]|nr:hypothetical protein [Oscillospiraceae bacterium]
MNRIYEKLRTEDFFKDKLEFDEAKNRLTITFNEYMRLDYLEGDYKAANDEGVILLNNSLTHWHITDDEEAVELVSASANGDVIYIEDTRFFAFTKLRIMEKETFEKKKEKYMTKIYLRIYTGNAIIKRNGN